MSVMRLVYEAHAEAARRNNASTQAVVQAWHMNGHNLKEAIVAGLMNLGGAHAPIKDTYRWIEKVYKHDVTDPLEAKFFSKQCNTIFYEHLHNKKKLPGFGSSIVKGKPDPMLDKLCLVLCKYNHISSFMRDSFVVQEKNLWPNLAYYTAIACLDQGININFCEATMIQARIEAWTELLMENEN